jgi:hypothetical protein
MTPPHRRTHPSRVLLAASVSAGLVLSAGPAFAAASDPPEGTWGTNGRVAAMVTVGGVTVIGGDFTAVLDPNGNSYPAAHLAVVDSSTGVVNRSWKGGTDDSVNSLAVLGSTLYVGGAFNQVDGSTHRNVAALSLSTGALQSTFRTTTNSPVDAITTTSAAVYVGGRFTSVTDGSGTTSRSFLAKVDPTTGSVDAGWVPTPDQRVRAMQVNSDGSAVYVAGDFTTVNGISHRSTALLPATAPGSPLSTFKGAPTNGSNYAPVLDVALVGSALYLAVAGSGGACTALNASTGARIWTVHTNGNVQAVTYNHGIVYCGGHFGGDGAFAGLTRYHLAAVTAASPYTPTSFAPHFNSALGIWSLAADNAHLFTGGDFTKVDHKLHNHYAVFDDTA